MHSSPFMPHFLVSLPTLLKSIIETSLRDCHALCSQRAGDSGSLTLFRTTRGVFTFQPCFAQNLGFENPVLHKGCGILTQFRPSSGGSGHFLHKAWGGGLTLFRKTQVQSFLLFFDIFWLLFCILLNIIFSCSSPCMISLFCSGEYVDFRTSDTTSIFVTVAAVCKRM